MTNSDSEWSVYQRAFSQAEKTALKSGLQTTKIAKLFWNWQEMGTELHLMKGGGKNSRAILDMAIHGSTRIFTCL